jgi:hypothetical protein
MCLACGDGEALFLVGVQVVGDRAARQAAPGEANDILPAILCGCRECDRIAGGWVRELSESGGRGVRGGHDSVFPLVWEEPFRPRYQSTVVLIATASGVPASPKVASNLFVSSTNDSSNS